MNTLIKFGTDGVRGPAGQWPITNDGARIIGQAIAAWTKRGIVFIGKDTRASGMELEQALIDGLVTGGSKVRTMGVVPTAAVSCAVQAAGADAGVMITASHNPWQDNGIKVVDRRGEKLTDTAPLSNWFNTPPIATGGESGPLNDPLEAWKERLPKVRLDGKKILLDAAHGAGFACAKDTLEEFGATVKAVASAPNGQNINDGVGAMHPPTDLQGCDLGICLDGDADRLVMVDPHQGIMDGDDFLWLLSRESEGPIVGTVMTNGGLQEALGERLVRTGVGDAKVWAEMLRIDACIGGEPSGHMMMKDGMPTSDGLYTALRILHGATDGVIPPRGWTRKPQAHRNVRQVTLDPNLASIHQARAAAHRVLVRASGTEPLVRVMVEGIDAERWAEEIARSLPRTHLMG
jgi:phosphoglucosamine mutase